MGEDAAEVEKVLLSGRALLEVGLLPFAYEVGDVQSSLRGLKDGILVATAAESERRAANFSPQPQPPWPGFRSSETFCDRCSGHRKNRNQEGGGNVNAS